MLPPFLTHVNINDNILDTGCYIKEFIPPTTMPSMTTETMTTKTPTTSKISSSDPMTSVSIIAEKMNETYQK